MTESRQVAVLHAKNFAVLVAESFGCTDPQAGGGPSPTLRERHSGCWYCEARHLLVEMDRAFPDIVAAVGADSPIRGGR